MTERYYRFAGLDFAVSMPEGMMYEKEYRLAPFGVDRVTDPHRFIFEWAEELTPPAGKCVWQQADFCAYEEPGQTVRYLGLTARSWEGAQIRVQNRGKKHHVQVKRSANLDRIRAKLVLNALMAEHLAVENHAVILHCSYIEHDGKAILFTAPSGTGKSTQADLWNRYRGAQIINGDRAAVRIAEDGRLLAEGIPFSGSSTYCENRSLPLEAIVYLAQAPQTSIRQMRGYEAFSRLWEGISINTWDKKDMELASDTIKRIVESGPVYHMPCTPDEPAVATLERTLRKRVNP